MSSTYDATITTAWTSTALPAGVPFALTNPWSYTLEYRLQAAQPAADAKGTPVWARTTAEIALEAGDLVWHRFIGASQDADLPLVFSRRDATAVQAALGAGESHVGEVGGKSAIVEASFSRPADTTAYASGDLVANATIAGNVTPMPFVVGRTPNGSGATGMIRRARIRKTGTSITNASFRLHLYKSSPTPSNGDNGAWLTNKAADYVGAIDITLDRAFTDGAAGNGTPLIGSEINFVSQTYYGLLEARGAYAPVSGETFTVDLEVLQN